MEPYLLKVIVYVNGKEPEEFIATDMRLVNIYDLHPTIVITDREGKEHRRTCTAYGSSHYDPEKAM